METTFGPVSVHVFGADDPTSMLEAQFVICRHRFESLIGERLLVDRPLRLFVFGKRSTFDAFFKWAFLYVSNLDGMYVPWSRATISISTEIPAHRLADLERTTRVLLTYYFLGSHRKSPSPLWAQTGISHVVASGGDEVESARLNRKMLAALSRGDSLGTVDLFHISPRSIVKLVRDWRDFDNFGRYSQLVTQSCSVVEFLCTGRNGWNDFGLFSGNQPRNLPWRRSFKVILVTVMRSCSNDGDRGSWIVGSAHIDLLQPTYVKP